MLDETQPPARLVAQMRLVANSKGLPEGLADGAAAANMTAAAFTKAAPMLTRMLQLGNFTFKGEAENPTMTVIRDAMGEGLEADALEERILNGISAAKIAQDGPQPAHFGAPTDRSFLRPREDMRAEMVAGLVARMDPRSPEAQKGGQFARATLQEIAMSVCRAAGLRPSSGEDAIRMATHSTSDFPQILGDSIGNLAARRIAQRMPDLARASREIDRMDYRAGRSLTLSGTAAPQEVAEGGEIKAVTASEKGELLPQVRDFASLFNITNKAMVNDRLDLLTDIADRMAQGAIERLRAVLLEPLLANAGAGQTMADGQAMFHSTHGNLIASGTALSITSLTAMRVKLRKMVGLQGEILAVEPWALVVPAELETLAQQLVATINAATFDDANPFSGRLEIIVEPGLTSATAYYLIGNPAQYDGLAHAFLDGQRAPRIESRPGWNTLGLELRSSWALDARFIETATWIKNPGTGS